MMTDMDHVRQAVKKLRELTRDSGCEDGNIVLQVNPDRVVCQFEKGACMEASFGGRVAEFVTFEPTRATTRLGFLFDAALERPAHRAAACAIINVMAGFLCISRIRRSCPRECHDACRASLVREMGDRRVGGLGVPVHLLGTFPVHTSGTDECEVILVSGEGLISPEADALINGTGEARILLVGPSTAGVASLEQLPHWCPYGKG